MIFLVKYINAKDKLFVIDFLKNAHY